MTRSGGGRLPINAAATKGRGPRLPIGPSESQAGQDGASHPRAEAEAGTSRGQPAARQVTSASPVLPPGPRAPPPTWGLASAAPRGSRGSQTSAGWGPPAPSELPRPRPRPGTRRPSATRAARCPRAPSLPRPARLPFGVLCLLLIVPVYPARVLVVQLQALLAGRRLAVLRHRGGAGWGGGARDRGRGGPARRRREQLPLVPPAVSSEPAARTPRPPAPPGLGPPTAAGAGAGRGGRDSRSLRVGGREGRGGRGAVRGGPKPGGGRGRGRWRRTLAPEPAPRFGPVLVSE